MLSNGVLRGDSVAIAARGDCLASTWEVMDKRTEARTTGARTFRMKMPEVGTFLPKAETETSEAETCVMKGPKEEEGGGEGATRRRPTAGWGIRKWCLDEAARTRLPATRGSNITEDPLFVKSFQIFLVKLEAVSPNTIFKLQIQIDI
jgi:hypothetical protein